MGKYKYATSKPPNERPTIGFLCEHLVDEYSASMWAGVRDAAWELGANLICFSGGMLRDPEEFKSQANMLYDLVDAENVDGLVLWGAQLIHHTTLEELDRFCERHRPLPIVSIGLALEGIPSLLVDNYQGMRDSVTHLIEVHGLQRIAYLCGPGDNPEVRDRYRGYTDALAEHGIPLDPSLIVLGSELLDESRRKNLESGEVGVRILLDERELKPQVDFEALVGHDDGTCRGASRELQRRGIRVPADVAIASFDDIRYARYLMPPLTTVQQSFYDLGWRGTEMLLAQSRGEKVPERMILPMEMVIRQSCGCVDSAVVAAGVVGERPDRVTSRKKLQDVLTGERENVIAEMMRGLDGFKEASRWANRVLDGFVAALATEVQEESSDIFLPILDDVLHQVGLSQTLQSSRSGQGVAAWHGVFSALRRHLLPILDDATLLQAENLWHQARVLIGETARRTEGYQALQAERQTLALREVGQALLTTFDLGGLMDVLAAGLPRLGIPSAYLSLYQDPQPYTYPQPAPKWSRLMLAQDRSGRVELEPDGQRFRSRQLMPDGLWPPERQYSFVVVPLYFRKQQMGFSLFEVGPREGTVYDVLRGDISSALHGALLMQAREQAEKALERACAEVKQQVAERTRALQQEIFERRRAEKELKRYRDRPEELVVERTRELEKAQAELVRQERLSALGQLTATVAHEIRNPLGTVRTAVFSIGDAIERDEVSRIERAIQLAERNIKRCDTIISELLDYTRDRVLQPSPTHVDAWLDRVLDEALEQCVIPEGVTCIRELDADIEVPIDSEHLRRVIINVVNNAIDAMQEKPIEEKKLLTVSTHLSGDRLEIQIEDTGSGIPETGMSNLFEPLFSTKSFGVGLGLPIVKSIMEQHGGGIEIKSQLDVGTTVVLWLPAPDREGA